MMQQQQLEQAVRSNPQLVVLVQQFYRAVDLQSRRDSETLAGLVRALSNPRGADAERFVELLRGIVRQELGQQKELTSSWSSIMWRSANYEGRNGAA
jgi:hypothetical protein